MIIVGYIAAGFLSGLIFAIWFLMKAMDKKIKHGHIADSNGNVYIVERVQAKKREIL
jgi:hypothetical protein